MSSLSNWPRNRLLLALPSSDLRKLMPELQQIPCERGQVLMDADSPLDQVYFPDSGVVSAVAVYGDGSIIEMATIGRRVALLCKPSSVPRFPLSGFSSRSRGAQQRCRERCLHGPWGRC